MSLIHAARRVAAQADQNPLDLPDDRYPADDFDHVHVQAGLAGRTDARDALPLAALLDALGPAGLRRVQGRDGLALVIEVPAPDWGTRVEMALRDLGAFAEITVKSGASRTQDKPSEGNGVVSAVLSRGGRIAGISPAPARYLPATLTQAADLVVRIGPPSNRVIAGVIKAVTGKRARRLPAAVAAGLTFDAITAAIRLGTSPASCIARLQASARALSGGDALGEDIPDLGSLAGYGPAMHWALALVRDLDEWRAGRLEFSQISKNCTLYSEPGLGKSSLIRSIAKAARVPLVSASVAELFTASSGHLDGVLKAWDAKIAQASAIAPSILFLDEIDSIPNRATMDNRGRDWWTPVVNGILASLDSTTSGSTSKVIVIGATNHIDLLDAALIRPGRLHPVIRIDRPDATALAGILRQHLGLDLDGVDLSGVAQLGAGSTGAEATAWIRAARSLARAGGRRMVLADLVAQVAPAETRTPAEIRAIARHEAAHCVCAVRLHVATMTSVSIADRRSSEGSARGVMVPRAFLTRSQLEAIAVVALAGRAMDALVGAPHTGAGGGRGSDLDRATEAVLSVHVEYGLGDGLAYRGGGRAEDVMRTDPALRRTVEADLLRLFAQASDLVRENRGVIEALATRLVEARVLSGGEIGAIIDAGSPAGRRGRRRDHPATR